MTLRTVDAVLRARATALGGKAAVKAFDGSSSWSYQDLDACVTRFTAELIHQGCREGDRVALGFGNTPDFFAALFACFRGGFIAVPIDPELAPAELQTILDHARPAVVVVDDSSASRFAQLRVDGALLDVKQTLSGRAGAASLQERPVAPADPALLLYTSGTTGSPKGVLLSHEALAVKTESIARWFGFNESFTSLCLLPTHFGHGLICNCLSTFGYGGTLIIAPPFDLDLISRLWSIVETHGVNTFSSVPTVARLLVQHAQRRAVKPPNTLRLVTCASAPLWPDDIEMFQSRFQAPLLNCYGLTETAGWSACSSNHPHRNPASVGHALGGEIRVVGADGVALPAGERGELQIRGPALMAGYYKNPTLTDEVLRDGWLATGDVGEIDATGAVFLHSRIKDLIIRAGKNIYPAEIDGVLMSHPEVTDACTVGLEDALLGETVAACVVRASGSSLSETGLIGYAREKLGAYKCPQRILFLERIPKTSRGKVSRSSLRPLFRS
jgi:acyl-CoA synthetase (AMP-forming)/AMP-acid ligase II